MSLWFGNSSSMHLGGVGGVTDEGYIVIRANKILNQIILINYKINRYIKDK